MSDFFWSVRDQGLQELQEERIRSFLRKGLVLAQSMEQLPASLLSHLGRLVAFVREVGPDEAEWLQLLARYVGTDFFLYEFAEQLTRLAPQYPGVVANAAEVLVASTVPSWDHNDQIKKLLLALGSGGQREIAIRLADRMRHLRGMVEVFDQLTQLPD